MFCTFIESIVNHLMQDIFHAVRFHRDVPSYSYLPTDLVRQPYVPSMTSQSHQAVFWRFRQRFVARGSGFALKVMVYLYPVCKTCTQRFSRKPCGDCRFVPTMNQYFRFDVGTNRMDGSWVRFFSEVCRRTFFVPALCLKPRFCM